MNLIRNFTSSTHVHIPVPVFFDVVYLGMPWILYVNIPLDTPDSFPSQLEKDDHNVVGLRVL